MLILVADDEEVVRMVVRRALTAADYSVIEVGNGEEGLRILRERGSEIDLILTDVVMPGVYGTEMVEEAQREGLGEWPVLFISAYTSHPTRAPAKLPDDANFLAKPFTTTQLLSALEEVAEQAGLEPPQAKVFSFPAG